VVVPVCKIPAIREAEVKGLQVQGKLRLYSEIVSQNQKPKEKKNPLSWSAVAGF
jgi:hypothetical protein